MKIRNTGHRSPFISTKKNDVKQSSFRSLLQSRLEKIRTARKIEIAEQSVPEDAEAWGMVENAVHLLDEAMEQIQRDGSPNADIVKSLQKIRNQLDRNNNKGRQVEEASTIIAVETNRLQAWDR